MSENGPSDAAIYARVSTSDQDVSRQLDEAREHLERLGMADIEEHPEIVSGAADTDTHEVYNQLLDDIEWGVRSRDRLRGHPALSPRPD